MENLKIATWDIKNSYFNIMKNEWKAMAIVQLLNHENLDLLALQEVNPMLVRKIEENLKKLNQNYRITTTYHKPIDPVRNLRIEYNMIISKMVPALSSAKEPLPSRPTGIKSFMFWNYRSRNMVTQLMSKDLIVDVTHLDHASRELGKRQMDEVLGIIENQRNAGYDVVLAGNLNCQPQEENMVNFTNQLSNIGMKVVGNPYKTYVGHTNEQPVDYVIIPNDWEVESINTLENYDDISSHRPVVVKTKKR